MIRASLSIVYTESEEYCGVFEREDGGGARSPVFGATWHDCYAKAMTWASSNGYEITNETQVGG